MYSTNIKIANWRHESPSRYRFLSFLGANPASALAPSKSRLKPLESLSDPKIHATTTLAKSSF
jgi:hypothetical protein